MDRIPPDLMGSLTPAVLQDVLRVLTEMNEEDQEVQEAWNRTTLNFHEEISNLAASNEADEAKWQIDRASLLAAAEAARQEERRRLQASLLQLAQEAQEVCHQATLLRMAPIQGRHAIAQADHTTTQADHTATQPEHAITQPEHSTQPEHAITQPEHAITQPEHAITQTEHSSTQPEQAITQPEHAITQPEDAITQPEDSAMGLPGSSTMGPDLEQLQDQEKGEGMGLVLERVKAWSGTLVVDGDATSAAHKQQLMADLREQADRWMEAPMAAGDSNTPQVFLTWGLREQWRKVQGNRPVLNDHLQAFLHKDAIEKQVRKHAQKERELDAQFEIAAWRTSSSRKRRSCKLPQRSRGRD
ncbi:uncharacterized protein LOC134460587 [Engraulis encrasicolus]|uniref:uncharacterized protein LOC134460587 n=1 Tax=Engraulis encrasicolus TaxID=184585 RepID=UPI002FD1A91A